MLIEERSVALLDQMLEFALRQEKEAIFSEPLSDHTEYEDQVWIERIIKTHNSLNFISEIDL